VAGPSQAGGTDTGWSGHIEHGGGGGGDGCSVPPPYFAEAEENEVEVGSEGLAYLEWWDMVEWRDAVGMETFESRSRPRNSCRLSPRPRRGPAGC